MRETKNGNLEKIRSIIDENPNIPQDYLSEYNEKKKNLINENGSGGWNALHFSIFCNHINIVKEFIEK